MCKKSEVMMESKVKTRYFIAKVDTFKNLQTCVETGRWACRDRVLGLQTRHMLTEAFKGGNVVIIYSVSGSHGWHGWAQMVSPPGCETIEQANDVIIESSGSTSNSIETAGQRDKPCPENLRLFQGPSTESSVISVPVFRNSSDESTGLPGCEHESESNNLCSTVVLNTVKCTSRKDNCVNGGNCVNEDTCVNGNSCLNEDNCVKEDRSNFVNARNVKENEQNAKEENKGEIKGASNHLVETKIDKNAQDWNYFNIQWFCSYIKEFGEHGLSFKMTESRTLTSLDGTPVNKCRNWQEVGSNVGAEMCNMMDRFLADLQERRNKKQMKQAEKQTPAFYTEASVLSMEQSWIQLIQKVDSTLGKVLIACPFGSQRYNLSIPESDTDMFIVYQAKTSQILGFNPPKQTIKSSEKEELDYSIMEIYRFCELLISGDARCVETLFLKESTVVHVSPEWQQLKQHRHLFLHRECLNKYLRDVQGAKGTRYLQKWCNDNKEEVLPPKLCKMLYVIVRLLQNARDIVAGGDLRVYRQDGSDERQQLMLIRDNNVPVVTAWQIIHRLEADIQEGIHQVAEKTSTVDSVVEEWLLQLRYHSFMQESPH